MNQLVILGRDGVINLVIEGGVQSAEQFEPIPGSLEAIARLNHSGFHVAVATNQPGVARGQIDIEAVNAIHSRMHQLLSRVGGHIDGLFICPHDDDAQCQCRKPGRGMLDEISKRFQTPLDEALLIGDELSDIQAAMAVNCPSVLVLTGKGQATVDYLPDNAGIPVADNLAQAVEKLLRP